MRTGTQQRYYDVLRREDRRRLNAPSLSGCGSNTTTTITTAGHSKHVASSLRGVSEDGSALWDPIEGMALAATTVVTIHELVCDHRGLTALHPHFTRFEQLHALVLSHNALRTVHHLLPASSRVSGARSRRSSNSTSRSPARESLYRGCRLLTHLHLDHNAIRDVVNDTDIPGLSLLEFLSLAFNQLTDLDVLLTPLYRLRHLRALDLRGNPLAEEPSYRQRCLAGLPQLTVLDGRAVTPGERRGLCYRDGAVESRLHDLTTAAAAAAVGSSGRLSSPSVSDTEDDRSVSPQRRHVTLGAVAASKTATKRGGRFAKSAIARDLDVRYAAHLRKEEEASVAAAEARAAGEREKEAVWGAFHAVWTLSQPGMPLSEDGWKTALATAATQLPASSTTAPITDGAAAAPGGRSARKTPSAQQPANTAAGRPRTPVFSGAASAMRDTSCESGVGRNVDVPRDRLLPLIAPVTPSQPYMQQQQQQQQQRDGTSTSGQHDSHYFRTVRGAAAEGTRADCDTFLSSAARAPSPVRLAALQDALHASSCVVRTLRALDSRRNSGSSGSGRGGNTNATSGAVSTGNDTAVSGGGGAGGGGNSADGERTAAVAAVAAAADTRKAAGSRTLSLSTTPTGRGGSATLPVDLAALRTIRANKYAMIPPPWEQQAESGSAATLASHGSGGGGGGVLGRSGSGAGVVIPASLGRVQPRTMVQEALIDVLLLLHHLFSKEELQLLEVHYGKAELLRLLPVDSLAAARQEMLQLLRPGTATGTGGGVGSSGGGGNAAGGGRRPAAEDRKKGGAAAGQAGNGGGGGRGGNAATQGSVSAAAAGGASCGLLTSSEMAAAALSAARAALPVDPSQVWSLFLQPPTVSGGVVMVVGRGGDSAAGGANGGSLSNALGSAANTNSSSGNAAAVAAAAASAAAAAAAAAATTATDDVSLSDPEAVQQLVRPVGPYEVRVLASFLKLLRPAAVLDAAELCEGLRAFHGVGQPLAAGAAAATSSAMAPARAVAALASLSAPPVTPTERMAESARVAPAGAKSKKDGGAVTSADRGDGVEGKKRTGKGHAGASSSTTTSANASGASAVGAVAASTSATLGGSSHDHGSLRPASPSLAPQMSLLTLLTALLFHPGFVRARLRHWEEELARQTMAAAAAAPTSTASPTTAATNTQTATSTGGGGGGATSGGKGSATTSAAATPTATPLSRLFHRVQVLKTHTARVEAAAAAQSVPSRSPTTESSKEMKPSSFVSPLLVLQAFS